MAWVLLGDDESLVVFWFGSSHENSYTRIFPVGRKQVFAHFIVMNCVYRIVQLPVDRHPRMRHSPLLPFA